MRRLRAITVAAVAATSLSSCVVGPAIVARSGPAPDAATQLRQDGELEGRRDQRIVVFERDGATSYAFSVHRPSLSEAGMAGHECWFSQRVWSDGSGGGGGGCALPEDLSPTIEFAWSDDAPNRIEGMAADFVEQIEVRFRDGSSHQLWTFPVDGYQLRFFTEPLPQPARDVEELIAVAH